MYCCEGGEGEGNEVGGFWILSWGCWLCSGIGPFWTKLARYITSVSTAIYSWSYTKNSFSGLWKELELVARLCCGY